MVVNKKRYWMHVKHTEILRDSVEVGDLISFYISNCDTGEYEFFCGRITKKYEFVFMLDNYSRCFTWKDFFL